MTTVWPSPSTASRSRSRMSFPVLVSSAPVGSSAKITSGRAIRARAIATRCCCPPESWPGRCVILVPRPTRWVTSVSQSASAAALRQPERERDVLLRRQRRNEVEGLEHEADAVSANLAERVLVQAAEISTSPRWTLPERGAIEAGGTVEERALAGPRRPHHGGERPTSQSQGDVAQSRDTVAAAAVHLADRRQPHAVGRRTCVSRSG